MLSFVPNVRVWVFPAPHPADHCDARLVNVRFVVYVLDAVREPCAKLFNGFVFYLALLVRGHFLRSTFQCLMFRQNLPVLLRQLSLHLRAQRTSTKRLLQHPFAKRTAYHTLRRSRTIRTAADS
jgi:hypothetical protein